MFFFMFFMFFIKKRRGFFCFASLATVLYLACCTTVLYFSCCTAVFFVSMRINVHYGPPKQTSEDMSGICYHDLTTFNLLTCLQRIVVYHVISGVLEATVATLVEHGSIIGGPPLKTCQTVWMYCPMKRTPWTVPQSPLWYRRAPLSAPRRIFFILVLRIKCYIWLLTLDLVYCRVTIGQMHRRCTLGQMHS